MAGDENSTGLHHFNSDQTPNQHPTQHDDADRLRIRSASLSSPASPAHTTERGSKSVQLTRPLDTAAIDYAGTATSPTSQTRRSTQLPRPSRDFDVRRDGPYGRPSVTMVRRRSSVLPRASHDLGRSDSSRPDLTDTDVEALEAYTFPPDARPVFEPEPPPLNYSLWDRRRAIAFFWVLIVVDCIAMPIVLYFCLWHLTGLSPNAVFSIVTAALGGVSIFEYFLRFWRLWKKDSTCRVIGARRSYLDWFHWNFTLGWIIIMLELIIGTVPENPPIRLLSMPLASMLYAFGTELLIVDTLRYFRVPAPCRMSSIPKGAQLRPAIYSIIEDVVAVDGSGGTEYREALNRRYEASHVFRAMLRRLGVFWAVGAEGMAVVTTIIVFTINGEAAYVVGWSAPFVWAGVWTLATFGYVHIMLKKEQIAWQEEIAEKQDAWGHGSDRGSQHAKVESSAKEGGGSSDHAAGGS